MAFFVVFNWYSLFLTIDKALIKSLKKKKKNRTEQNKDVASTMSMRNDWMDDSATAEQTAAGIKIQEFHSLKISQMEHPRG